MRSAWLSAVGRVVDKTHLDVARSFGAGPGDRWLTVILPSVAWRLGHVVRALGRRWQHGESAR